MAVSKSFEAYVLEQLSSVNGLSSRRMFGGVGISAEGLSFALIDDDTLYLKVDDTNRGDFEAIDMGPFRPYGDDRAMQYYQVSVDVLEDADALQAWARKAIDVARSAKTKKRR